jgi:hypothetical protein
MKRSKILILSLLLGFFISNYVLADPPDNTLLNIIRLICQSI